MELEIRICPYEYGRETPNRNSFHTMWITLRYRGRVYQKEEINPLPELHSVMDYLFEAARREMKEMILAYMQTGSPIERKAQGYFETPGG